MPEGTAEQTGQQTGEQSTQQTGQQQTQQTQQTAQTQNTPGSSGQNSGDWERERQGLLRETQKERQARQRFEGEVNNFKTQLEQANKRIAALAGVTPKSQEEQDDEEIRRRFSEKFPHLAELTEDDIKAIRENRQHSERLLASERAMWTRHGNQMLAGVHNRIAEALGGEAKDLTDRQKNSLKREYLAFIEEHAMAGKNYIERHEAGDETLLDEFAQSYLKDWQDSIRRSVTSTEVGQRPPLPSGKGRSIASTGPRKIDFNDEKKTQDAAVDVFKSYGGRFGS